MILVILAVGYAALLTIRYLGKLWQAPPADQPAHCAGCDMDCDVRELVPAEPGQLRISP